MGMLKFMVPHTLSKEDARARMEALLRHWADKYGIQQSWSGDTAKVNGKVMGIQLAATLTVQDRAVEGEASDPGMLLRGQARKYLEEKLRSFLDAARTLADITRGKG
jgi:putative polyhydroxyalkanoate system protein